MSESIAVPKDEYDLLKHKADLFDHFIETEELSKEDLEKIKKAMRGPFLSKGDFLKKHSDLA